MQWTVGKVKITKVVELESTGGTRFILPQATPEAVLALPWLVPDYANEQGRLKMTIKSLVVDTPTHRILVDTGLGNDKQGRSVPLWNDRNGDFLEDLAAAGAPADSIDMVICTHLHVDHVGWNTRLKNGNWIPTFSNARYIFGKTEYEHWKQNSADAEHAAVFQDSIKPIITAGRADLVASDAQLTPEISLISTPGHSPGHVSILIRSEGEEALLSGDVAHHPIQMAHLDWSSTFDSNEAQSTATRHELFNRFADTRTVVIGGHFDAGYIKRDGNVFRLEALQA